MVKSAWQKLKWKVIKFMGKKHVIVLGLEQKCVILILLAVFGMFIIPTILVQDEIKGFNDEVYLICTHAGLYQCEDLAKAEPYCMNAHHWYINKNCSGVRNLTSIEKALTPLRLN